MSDADRPHTDPKADAKGAVARAWDRLRDALAAEALADPEAFERLTGFRATVVKLQGRYAAGQPAHTVPQRQPRGAAASAR